MNFLKRAPVVAIIGWLLALPLSLFLTHGPLQAAQYVCDEVDKEAIVGAFAYDVIVMSVDESEKICRFSVNGAAAGSPPQEDLTNSLRGLVGVGVGDRGIIGNLNEQLGESDVLATLTRQISTLILAAGPDEITDGIEKIILGQSDILEDCLWKFAENVEYRNEGDVECGVTSSVGLLDSDDPQLYRSGPFSVKDTQADSRISLILTVRRGSIWNILVLPKRPQ